MTLPNFLIVGAMKCGTSTLHAQVSRQKGVFMCTPKEPNFFSDDDQYARGPDWYAALFADAGDAALIGEGSTHYAKAPTYPDCIARMRAALDRPKVIYLIRNPVERLVSHFIHDWTTREGPGDFRAALDPASVHVQYGRYPMQIAPYLDWLGPERVYLTSLEAMTADPAAELNRVARFLDAPAPFEWIEEQTRVNVSAERIRPFPLYGPLVESRVATAIRRAVVPQAARDVVKKLAQRRTRPELSQSERARLEDIFAEDHGRLTALFPGNDRIAPAYPFAL